MIHASTLEAVTVFARGALCTRRIALAAENGRLPERVRVEGLPLTLDAGKLRASVRRGPNELQVRELKADFAVREARPAEVPAAKDELKRATERLRSLEQRRMGIAEQHAELSRVRPTPLPPAEGAPPRPAAVEGVLALATAVDEELTALTSHLGELDREWERAHEEVEHWQRVLRDSTGQTTQTVIERAVEISLSPAAGDSAELVLEYAVRGARWVPSYALALEPGYRSGQLSVRAQIAQKTGEDWTDVKLSVSTADLLRRVELLTLPSLRIGRAQPPPPSAGWREAPSGLDELLADFRAQAPRPPVVTRPPPPPKPPPPPPLELGGLDDLADYDADEAPELEASYGAPAQAAPSVQASISAPRRSAARAAALPPPGAAPAPSPKGGGGEYEKLRKRSAPMKSAKRDSLSADLREEEEEQLEGTEPLPSPGAPAEAWLEYGNLQLAGPFDGQPGRLSLRADKGALPKVRGALQEAESGVRAAEGLPLPPRTVVVKPQQFDDRYDAEHPVRVPQDARWHTVPLFTAEAAFGPELVCVPSLDRRVYRTLELKNRSPHALLEGPADVTVGGMFLATVTLPAVPPGGAERLGLGVEEAVQVSRNVRFREETGGLLGGTTLLIHEIDVEVVNRLSSPVSLKVRERVPTSEEREVVVEELAQKPSWKAAPIEAPVRVNGAREWAVELPAGARQQLEAKFQIRIPSGRTLEGGNRRF